MLGHGPTALGGHHAPSRCRHGIPGLGQGLGLLPARSAASGVVYDTPQKGDSMAATGDTLHWTLNGLLAIAETPLFDSATLLGELYYSNLLSLDSKNEALYKGEDTYRGIDKPTRDNWGLAVNFTPTWYQVFPGVDLSAPLSISRARRSASCAYRWPGCARASGRGCSVWMGAGEGGAAMVA